MKRFLSWVVCFLLVAILASIGYALIDLFPFGHSLAWQ